MKNNRNINLLFTVVFASMLLIIFLLFTERNENNIVIHNLEQEAKFNDSINNYKINKYLKIIEDNSNKLDSLNRNKKSYNGFSMGNKSISVEELLDIVNKTLEENTKLKNQVDKDKVIINYIEETYGIKVIENNGEISLKLKPDSNIKNFEKKSNNELNKLKNDIEEKDFILKQLQKKYGFKYEVKTENDKIHSSIFITKLDSALWLYPHYKHKIKEDKNGNIIIK
jgi:hypothetical protein